MSLLFDNALNQYLSAPAAPVTGVPLTMSIWYYPDEDGVNFQTPLSLADSGSATDYVRLAFMGGVAGDPMRAYTRAGATNVNAGVTGSNINAWNHALGVYASTTSRFAWVNGSKSAENTTEAAPSAFDRIRVAVGAQSGGVSTIDFSGGLAEAAVYDGALDDDEALALRAGYSPLLVKPGSLRFYLKMIRDDYQDLIGGLSFTPNGTPTVAAHPRIIYPAPKLYSFPTGAPPAGLSIPIAMHHYKQLMGVN